MHFSHTGSGQYKSVWYFRFYVNASTVQKTWLLLAFSLFYVTSGHFYCINTSYLVDRCNCRAPCRSRQTLEKETSRAVLWPGPVVSCSLTRWLCSLPACILLFTFCLAREGKAWSLRETLNCYFIYLLTTVWWKYSCGHIMASFDLHDKCARCWDKLIGEDNCMLDKPCPIYDGFSDTQREMLSAPSYKMRKDKKAGLLVSPKGVTILQPVDNEPTFQSPSGQSMQSSAPPSSSSASSSAQPSFVTYCQVYLTSGRNNLHAWRHCYHGIMCFLLRFQQLNLWIHSISFLRLLFWLQLPIPPVRLRFR